MGRAVTRRARLIVALAALALVGCGASEPALPVVEVVTVVVSATPGPTQTPWVVTTVERQVVTATVPRATPSRTATGSALTTARVASPTRAPRQTVVAIASPTRVISPTRGAAAPLPTVTVTPRPSATVVAARRYAPVTLRIPADGEGFGDTPPILEWIGIDLGPDEYYEVTIEREWQGELHYAGSDWVREARFPVAAFVRGTSDSGEFRWWVTVKRLTGTAPDGSKVGVAISPPSERRIFFWNP